MKHYFLPINHDDYVTPFTKPGHGVGKLDMAFGKDGINIYSMIDGRVVFNSLIHDSSTGKDCTCLSIRYDSPILNKPIYIRYLHGIYNVNVDTEVKKGDTIGTVSNQIGYSTHLHIDFSYSPGSFQPVEGKIDGSNFIIGEEIFRLNNSIDLNQVESWRSTNADPDSTKVGYCWLVFASHLEEHEPSGPSAGGIPIDKDLYNTCPNTGPYVIEDMVNAYFYDTIKDDFCGKCPESWSEYKSEDCAPLRCLVDFCHHEFGNLADTVENHSPFVLMPLAKIWRVYALGGLTVHDWATKNGEQINNLQDLIMNASRNATKAGYSTNYGRPEDNDGTNFLKTHSETDENLNRVRAIYKNFKYRDIYGESLHIGTPQLKKAIVDSIRAMPTNNNLEQTWFNDSLYLMNFDVPNNKDDGKNAINDGNHAVASRLETLDDATYEYHPEILE